MVITGRQGKTIQRIVFTPSKPPEARSIRKFERTTQCDYAAVEGAEVMITRC